jgi:hypothetical protein
MQARILIGNPEEEYNNSEDLVVDVRPILPCSLKE